MIIELAGGAHMILKNQIITDLTINSVKDLYKLTALKGKLL